MVLSQRHNVITTKEWRNVKITSKLNNFFGERQQTDLEKLFKPGTRIQMSSSSGP